jgi:hypothetical protein
VFVVAVSPDLIRGLTRQSILFTTIHFCEEDRCPLKPGMTIALRRST